MIATLGGHPLTLGNATFGSFFNTDSQDWSVSAPYDLLRWNIRIDATDDSTEYEGILLPEPVRFYHESFRFPKQAKQWDDLTGQIIRWSDQVEAEEDVSTPSLYLWGHHNMAEAHLQFVERDGCNFRIVWTGVSEGYGPFFVDTWVMFERG